ncbi:tyrosine-type recombinase/integrase [Nocardioides bruguierae]|uniref:Site-specific integrase n=1 Tax=Nocardioides bruguierae TaxID=2945102 RepID=A0A9X2D479_9ACTN|nr:site-specific integrase [Nocardioides bruguierae]MCM0618740.1 site-specific integrase [Nocardioides bruguierae]
MASIAKRDNGRWRARYRDEAGKEHARHFDRKVDAQRWLDQVTATVVNGEYVDPRAGRVTFERYARQWQSVQVAARNTENINDNALRVHLIPRLGPKPMATIRPTEIQSIVKQLEIQGLKPATVRGIYHVCTQVFRAAVDDRVISRTPCSRIKLPPLEDAPVHVPTPDDVARLMDAMEPRHSTLVAFLAGSGLRIGEALGLMVADVDFLRRTVSVERQRYQNRQLGPLKSKSSRRIVPLGQSTVDALAEHLTLHPSSEALWTDPFGDPLAYRPWRGVMARANATAGTDFGSHSLRHFYASALIAGGASVKQVQERLGHSSPVITLEIYAHLWPGDDDRTRSVIDAAMMSVADSLRTRRAAQ